MARSKKKKHSKSMSQKVISAGTSGLPSPIRSFLSGRLVAGLIVLCLPLLFISGIVSVDFQNGRPHLSFNRNKAKEAKVMRERMALVTSNVLTMDTDFSSKLPRLMIS